MSTAPVTDSQGPDGLPDGEVEPPIGLSTLVVGDTAVVRIHGDLDHHTGSHLVASARSVLDSGARNLVVDCANTSFLDSGGLEVLLELRDIVHSHAGVLTVRNCSESIRRVFAVTALTQHLGVEPGRRP